MEKETLKKVFLTFDDGPNEPYTSEILNVLKKFGAKATFFVCGKNAERYPETVKRIVGEGHLVANHTYSHSKLRAISGIWGKEIDKTNQIIFQTAGVSPKYFRPPWGLVRPWLRTKIRRAGYKLLFWDVHASDWEQPPAEVIARRIINQLRPDSVALLHDGRGARRGADRSQTVASLPLILEYCKKASFKTETVDKLTG